MGSQGSKDKNELSNRPVTVNVESPGDSFVNGSGGSSTDSVNNSNNICEMHSLKLNFFCQNEKCFMPVCGDCLVLDHDKSKGHVVVNITDVLNSNILDDMKKAKKEELLKIRGCVSELEKVRDSQEQNRDFVTALIHKQFEKYHELLDKRKQSLLEELTNQSDEKFKKLQSEVKNSQQRAHSLSQSLRTFSSARGKCEYTATFKTYSELKSVDLTDRYMNHFDLLDSLTFASTNGNEFEQAVVKVGEIKEEVCNL